jgi:hypothetical protein
MLAGLVGVAVARFYDVAITIIAKDRQLKRIPIGNGMIDDIITIASR